MANLIGIAAALAKTRRGGADVTDELGGAGLAFGDLLARTGDAVARTQRALNQTSAASATALAGTKVDVIAVSEKVFDDLGTLTSSQTHTRKLPLVNFIDPVFYEWSNVRLQGTFFAREFKAESSSDTAATASSSGSTSGGVSTPLSFLLGPARVGRGSSTTVTTSVDAEVETDISTGTVRLNALLRPRRDVGVPKPNQAIQGPRIAIIEGPIVDVSGPPPGRTINVLVEYHRLDGTPIQGKALSIDTHGVAWQFVGATTTDAQGRVEIQLEREFLDPEADTAPVDVIVEARIGLVSNSVTVTF